MSRSTKKDQQQSDRWERAYQEVEHSREQNSRPDTSQFADLTKSSGGRK
jgi:hypothetical protein